MVRKSFWGGVIAAALAISPASAAEGQAQLISTNGKVLINQGAGFVQPSDSMSLNAGDKIFVGHEASAVITYVADSCQVAVPADRVTTIEILSPCQKNAIQIQPAADLPQNVQAYEPEFPVLPVVVIGGGIIACAILCFNDHPDSSGDKDKDKVED